MEIATIIAAILGPLFGVFVARSLAKKDATLNEASPPYSYSITLG